MPQGKLFLEDTTIAKENAAEYAKSGHLNEETAFD
jgi:hypothetical protein